MKNTLMLYVRMGFIMLVNLILIRLVMEPQLFNFALVGLVFSAPFGASKFSKIHIRISPSQY